MPHGRMNGHGAKLIPAAVRMAIEGTIVARAKLAPHEALVHQAAQKALIDMAGEEKAAMLKPFFQHVLDNPDTHPILKTFVEQGTSGHHQWQAELFSNAAAYGAQNLIGQLLSAVAAPAIYSILAGLHPVQTDPILAARVAAQGFATYDYAIQKANFAGFDDGYGSDLFNSSLTFPAPDQIFAMFNRGAITEHEAKGFLTRNALPANLIEPMWALHNEPISPAEAADMVVRGIITQTTGEVIAAQSGVSQVDFDRMVLDTGEPPSLTDLGLAFRRGVIDQARFVHGIRQSRVRDEWVDVIQQVQYAPMSVADAITAYVQGHMTEAQAKEVAHLNGLLPQYFDPLYQTAGEPISKTEVLELLRRKEITTAEADQAIKESRLKDKYIPFIHKLAVQIPPAREVATLYSHGALTQAQATTLMDQSGYTPEVTKAFLDSAIHGKVAALKNITLGQASRLYVEGIISWPEAGKLLAKTGYQPAELSYVKLILDDQRLFRNREASITKIRTLYEAYHIDRTVASAQMDALHVQSQERDALLSLWDITRTANAKILTKAEIVDAAELGLIQWIEAIPMLEQIGYSHANAVLIAEIKAKGQIPGVS